MKINQQTYNPANYCFEWYPSDGWYKWHRASAHTAARKDRDAEAKRLKAEGKNVRKWSQPNQLISRGGIGSGRPHIEMVVTVYGLTEY